MNIALIIAAGVGKRTGSEVPKQFVCIREKPILIYTLEVFQKHPAFDAIGVVCLSGWQELVKSYARQYGISKLQWFAEGGVTGQESIYNGIMKLNEHAQPGDAIFIHDAVRPLLNEEILNNLISTYDKYGSGVVAIPCTEAILKSSDALRSKESVPRDQLFRTQTPQAYSLEKLLWAHDEAAKRGITNSVSTCTLMSELGEEVFISPGQEQNMKITTEGDILMIEKLMELKSM